jgi:hypothetical protein
MAVSEVAICNSALLKIGGSRINSLTEDSRSAKLCNEQYSKIRDAALASHPWNFALKRAQLAKLVTPPVFGFDNQFQLPADYLRVLKTDLDEPHTHLHLHHHVSTHNHGFKIEGDKLLTDVSEVKILYIFRETNVGVYSPEFDEYLATRLAADLAYPLVQSVSLTERALAQAERVLKDVRSSDAQEGTPDPIIEDTWINSRI